MLAEKLLVNKIQKMLRGRGAWVIKTTPGANGNPAGCPDLIFCWHGRFFALEVKRPGYLHKATPLQLRRLFEIEQAGGEAIVVDCVEAVEALLAKHRPAP